ncbi:cytochrome b/b6 domain-containing protein [Ideonella sp.]|uniref:cytochrome b/b6 domain-containing protein n=1 Tax=Ideonella sp. TaxID=1929293 RepID=UPI0035B0258B
MNTINPSSPAAASTSPRDARAASRLVIDAPVRAVHWLLAASFAGAWLTAESEQWRALHNTLGYLVLGLLAFRLVYGLAGPRPARLGVWWRKLRASPAWWRSLREPGASWRPAQNVAMAATVLGLALALIVVGLSGWGLELDGGAWLEEVHEAVAEFSLLLVLAHLGALAVLSALRGRNQALPMLTGRQPGPGADVVRPRRALAAAVLAAAAAFVAWQWQQSPQGLWPAGGEGPASGAASWTSEGVPVPAHGDGDDHDEDDDD